MIAETIIIAVITSGIISTFVTPYITWQFHLRKDRREKRLQLLEKVRMVIIQKGNDIHWPKTPEFHQFMGLMTDDELMIYQYLLNEYQLSTNSEKDEELPLSVFKKFQDLFTGVIYRLEKRWKLI